jgi:hypothetical protein
MRWRAQVRHLPTVPDDIQDYVFRSYCLRIRRSVAWERLEPTRSHVSGPLELYKAIGGALRTTCGVPPAAPSSSFFGVVQALSFPASSTHPLLISQRSSLATILGPAAALTPTYATSDGASAIKVGPIALLKPKWRDARNSPSGRALLPAKADHRHRGSSQVEE